jgi:hypothetical protein
MADVIYPKDGAGNVYINPRWIAAPVHVPGSIANCYIHGTGVGDFTDDPPWDDHGNVRLMSFELHLTFVSHYPAQPGDSPLEPSDTVFSDLASVTVGLAHIDHDIEGAPTAFGFELLGTEIKKVARGDTTLQVVVKGTYWLDVWIDRLAYQIDMLVYRPAFDRPQPRYHPLTPEQLARMFGRLAFRPGGP